MHGGFEVWLLKGCGPNLCFPKAFGQSTRFPKQTSGDMSPYFVAEIRHCFALGVDMDYDNHTKRGKHVYIYIYTHHAQCKHIEKESKCLHP